MIDTCICIPSKRPAPLSAIESHAIPDDYNLYLVSDPNLFEQHLNYYGHRHPQIKVVLGKSGMGAQSAMCYEVAHSAGFPFFVRLDDDIHAKSYIAKSGGYETLHSVILALRQCLNETQTTLAGLVNGVRRDWLKDGFSRSYGFVHGSTNIAISAADPTPFINPTILCGEDTWRACAHRKIHGANGRVNFIGIDKANPAYKVSAIQISEEIRSAHYQKLLETFPDMVEVRGMKTVINHGQEVQVRNWRMKRPKNWNELKVIHD